MSAPLDPVVQRALNSIGPAELKGDLSFLASDALAGRYSPSPGLDVAAEFIASRFRAIGLQPVSGDSYFQLAPMVERKLTGLSTPLMARDANRPVTVAPDKMKVVSASSALRIDNATVVKMADMDSERLKQLDLSGKVVLTASLNLSTLPEGQRREARRKVREFDKIVSGSGALAEIKVGESMPPARSSQFLFAEDLGQGKPPVVQVNSVELSEVMHTESPMTLSLDIPPPEDETVTEKNVVGILRGTDSQLKSTCMLVTAHYDHIGTTQTADHLAISGAAGDDKIYNGANDDGSGTVSVIAVARALARLHPKRSIVFIAFFGEERGLLGSTFYGRHPIFPLAQTIADLNLEQVGRTDSTEGPQIATASLTGYDYSGVTKFLEDAGKQTGIEIYKDDAASDAFFERSDNAALAEHGVPAHTLTTAFEYPDYHAVGDEWQKIDYANMAKVDRAVALAVLNMANSRVAPAWNEANPKTRPFAHARKALD